MIADQELSVRNVSKRFGIGPSSVAALRSVSIVFRRGCFAIIKGPSGSGKSSLLAAMSGLQPPDEGEVWALGENVWAHGQKKVREFRRRKCGFVFQSHGLFPALGALDQIAAPLMLIGVERREAVRRAQEALELMGLSDRSAARPEELSGGQNQRVAIARMLAKQSELLFCDEPTAALDSRNGRLVGDLLSSVAKQRNAMVICVTHDERLTPIADRILQIEDGEITSDTDSTCESC